jgi:hypothetical protein
MTKHPQPEAARLLDELLHVRGPDLSALLAAARTALGGQRLERCLLLVRQAPLTRRSHVLASLAALVVATEELGEGWWHRPGPRPSPDEVLASGAAREQPRWPNTLESLSHRAADDVADALWGPPTGDVDLNSLDPVDRIALPPDARAGDRLVVSFDPGSRVDAEVTSRPDGSLGSVLDLESVRHSPATEAEWAWGVSAGVGPHRLPFEAAGGSDDPYGLRLDEAAGATLSAWAIAHGATAEQIRPPWTVAGDAIRALEAMDLVHRGGSWFAWWRATDALADRDAERLAAAMADLGPA